MGISTETVLFDIFFLISKGLKSLPPAYDIYSGFVFFALCRQEQLSTNAPDEQQIQIKERGDIRHEREYTIQDNEQSYHGREG